ncbi:replication-relaxation family protein [Paenibacillus sp. 1A_MP2]|uniref:replication-relaxation family protein n=1 Tax=Paenibacillus sp. 1A_MP2 TaxID=3457495 RepID=UPI003FCE6B50
MNTSKSKLKPDSSAERKRKKDSSEYTLGETIDLLTDRDWEMLTDLYMCRCMPQQTLLSNYFLDTPEYHYPEYGSATGQEQRELEQKNENRAITRLRRTVKRFKARGLLEYSTYDPNSSDKPSHRRTSKILGVTWYYLSSRGLKIVEIKKGILEENRLSKNDLDMERAKKDHFWELGKVYLDLRYKWMNQDPDLKQYHDWDWYPSLSVYSDNDTISIRPDAVLRIGQQVFFVELDRSTEPIQRSPFHTDQVSIEKKLERYRDVMKLTSNKIIRDGIIAFIVPNAIYNKRLTNIENAAQTVFGINSRVLTGRSIGDVISAYSTFSTSQ